MEKGAEERLLFANEAFYAAFAAGDMATMAEIWSEQEPCFCIHPGRDLIAGRDSVLASWKSILAGGSAAPEPQAPRAEVAETLGLVICLEAFAAGTLIATNLFRWEGKVWRLYHHHAGPLSRRPGRLQDTARGPRIPS